jgi:LPXTG-motif cell wall-anchored protein
VTFTNSATVTHLGSATPVVNNVTTQRRSVLVGGDANGVVPSATTTTTVAPTTTVAAIAPPPGAPPTTLVAALPPVPPTFPQPPAQLPATGANGTLLGVGAFTFLMGTLLMVVATRRRRPI